MTITQSVRHAIIQPAPAHYGDPPIMTTRNDDEPADLQARIGAVGEGLFEALASAAGTVPNKVVRDLLGWDYHVQLPRAASWRPRHTIDTRPAEPSCFVQVKTTTRPIRSWSVALSTWERLAKERRPVFFAIMILHPATLALKSVYLVHLGRPLLEEVLRALCEIEPDDVASLRNKELSFRWSDDDEILPAEGHSLLAAMLRHVGQDIHQYEHQKEHLVCTLGYPERPLNFDFEMTGASRGELERALAEFSVGARKHLLVDITGVTEERFGVQRPPGEPAPVGEARMEIQNLVPDVRCDLAVVPASRRERLRLPCEIYYGGGFLRAVPPDSRVIRVTAEGAEFLLSKEKEGVRVRSKLSLPEPGDRMSLSRAVRRANTILAITDPAGCQLVVRTEDHPLAWSHMAPQGKLEYLTEYSETIIRASKLASILGLDLELQLDPSTLTQYADSIRLATAEGSLTVAISLKPVERASYRGACCAVFLPREVQLGSYLLFLVLGVVGIATEDSEVTRLDGAPQLFGYQVFDTECERVPDIVDGLLERSLEAARSLGAIHIMAPEPATGRRGIIPRSFATTPEDGRSTTER